jgi:DNA-directed RNA polymerase I, II, and III subunit RPABC2
MPLLSKYEYAKVIGMRAEQINCNSPLYVEVKKSELKQMGAMAIAELELLQGAIPFIIRRHLSNGEYEEWKLSELELRPNR